MTLGFHKTSIYYKLSYAHTTLNQESFSHLCRKIQDFPLKQNYAEIKGLYLRGEHFFKRILLSDADNLDLSEIEQIKSISPIVDQAPMPFIMENNYFEVNLPTEDKSLEELMDYIFIVEEFYKDLFDDITGQKIEVHLRGEVGSMLSGKIYKNTIPHLPKGDYQYQTIINNKIESGETSLPVEYSELPENIKGLVSIIRGPYTFKMISCQNKLIIKLVKRMEIGVSVYSGKTEWFRDSLEAFRKRNILEKHVHIPKKLQETPHLG